MAVNRYTDLTTSSFNPFSLEELALVPSYKRKQHDEILAKQELISAGLAKVDPLDPHFKEAMRLKQGIEGKIDETAAELANRGINNDMIGKTMALNRQYQDLVSPTGRIGKINNAKIEYANAKKRFLENPAHKDIPSDVLQKRWEEFSSKYTGFEGEGDDESIKNITNIGDLSAPGYQNLEKDIMDWGSRLGDKTTTELKRVGAHFVPGPFGGLILQTADGEVITTSNDENLQALKDNLTNKWISAKGEGRKYADFAYMDQQNILDAINSSLGIMAKDKEIKRMDYKDQYIAPPASTGSGDDDGNAGVIDVQHNINIDKFTKRSYGANQIEHKKLKAKIDSGKYEAKDLAEFKALDKFVSQTDDKAKKDPLYYDVQEKAKKFEEEVLAEAPPGMKPFYEKMMRGELKGLYRAGKGWSTDGVAVYTVDPFTLKEQGLNAKQMQDLKRAANKYFNNPYEKQKWEILNYYNSKNNNVTSDFYQLDFTDVKKSEGKSKYDELNKLLEGVLTTGTTNGLRNLGIVSSIHVDGASKFDIKDDDVKGIQKLITEDVQPGSMKIGGFSENNVTGLPTVRISFNTRDSSKGYNMSGVIGPQTGDIGAKGKMVSFDLDFNALSNIPNNENVLQTRNIVGRIVEFIYDHGGPRGQQIALKMMKTLKEQSKN
jgi:hypothetical protein